MPPQEERLGDFTPDRLGLIREILIEKQEIKQPENIGGLTRLELIREALAEKEASIEKPGFFRKGVSAIGGGMLGAGEMYGRAIRGLPGGEEAGIGKEGISGAILRTTKGIEEAIPILKKPEDTGAIYQGIRSAVTSLTARVPYMAAGAALGSAVAPGLGTFIGALGGYIFGGATLFGLAEYDSFIENAVQSKQFKQGKITKDQIESGAIKSGLHEAGWEFASDIITGVVTLTTGGIGAPVGKAGMTALKEWAKTLFKTSGKEMAKRATAIVAGEVSTEMATAGFQTEEMYKLGLTDARFMDGMKQAFGPAFVASLIFAGFFEGGARLNRRKVKSALENAKVNPEIRTEVVNYVQGEMAKISPELADTWGELATQSIENNESISMDEKTIDKTAEFYANKMAVLKKIKPTKLPEAPMTTVSEETTNLAEKSISPLPSPLRAFGMREKPIEPAPPMPEVARKPVEYPEQIAEQTGTTYIGEAGGLHYWNVDVGEGAPTTITTRNLNAEELQKKVTATQKLFAVKEVTPKVEAAKEPAKITHGKEPLFYDENENAIVFERDDNRISVNKIGDATRVVLWSKQIVKGKEYYRKSGALNATIKTKKVAGEIDEYLNVSEIEIEKAKRGQRLGIQMYRELIDNAPANVKGIISYTPNRVNKTQIPSIYKRLGAFTEGDYEIIPIKQAKPAPKEEIKPAPELTGEVKQPYLMTKDEYVDGHVRSPAMHKYGIKKALSEGKLTPAEAIRLHKAAYPDIETWPEMGKKVEAEKIYFGGEPLDLAKTSQRGISLSTDPATARKFANAKKGRVQEFRLSANAKIVNFEEIPKGVLPKTGGWEGVYTAAAKWAKANGYDAINFGGEEKEIRVINPAVLEAAPTAARPAKPTKPATATKDFKGEGIGRVGGKDLIAKADKLHKASYGLKPKNSLQRLLEAKQLYQEAGVGKEYENFRENERLIKNYKSQLGIEEEAKVEIETTPEGKEVTVDLTKKEETALTPKQQKEYLMAEIDKAIEGGLKEAEFDEGLDRARELLKLRVNPLSGVKTLYKFEVPNDGTFEIVGSNLFEFQDRVKSAFPATIVSEKFKPKKPAGVALPVKRFEKILGVAPEKLKPADIDRLFKEVADTEARNITGNIKLNPFQNWLLSQNISKAVIDEIRSVAGKDYIDEAYKEIEATDLEHARSMVEYRMEAVAEFQDYVDSYKEGTLTLGQINKETGIKRSGRELETALSDANHDYTMAVKHLEDLEKPTGELPKYATK
ncbi:MAG: hypothetical protein Q7J15_07765 [Candidatus Desulfaltia sp.]|nr:hypothetical protein [Candidatus Desulfaltia sp.]